MNSRYTQINPQDNILVALMDLEKDMKISFQGKQFILKEDIERKHKFALKDFKIGDLVLMYGVVIGEATKNIEKGFAITIDNVKHSTEPYTEIKRAYKWSPPNNSKFKSLHFEGYHRPDGKVGTSNYWIVVPLVFCENRNLDVIESTLCEKLGYQTKKNFALDPTPLIKKYHAGASHEEIMETSIYSPYQEAKESRVFPNVDGIKFLKHSGGCGGTQQDAEALCNLIAGYVCNPNVAGATIMSLGCQKTQSQSLRDAISRITSSHQKPIYFVTQQKLQSERVLIETTVKKTFIGLIQANEIKRQPAPLSKLILGLECGGSDGFSGISANPALGYVSDLLVALGGKVALAEFPELNGVESNLIRRCKTSTSAKKFVALMESYNNAARSVGSGFENNPSPGNIKDGLITDAMKSAGAAKKGGSSPISDVLDYTEQITQEGLSLLCTPGNDVESTTALAGSGCNITVFTTGLGTPTGNPIMPIIKVSSNSDLYQRMGDIIDFDAGKIIKGEKTIEELGEELLFHLIDVASGKCIPKAVLNGNDDFIPWKRGVSL